MGQMWQSTGLTGSTGGMGGMMGGGGTGTTANSNLWIIPVSLIVAIIIGIIGFSFYLLYPQIRNISSACEPKNGLVSTDLIKPKGAEILKPSLEPNSCEVVLKTMTPEEKKVLSVLIAHKGRYLQKYVGKEAALSRLKTHRIVARFAERGIVTVKPLGNTNEITVSEWVKGSKGESSF